MAPAQDRDATAMENGLRLKYSDEHPPPLPPKDIGLFGSPNLDSYFMPLPPSRPASIYSVNRASLSGQLSQLTSIDLPDAESLAARVSEIPTATAASKALSNAASQIKSWIKKAAEVLGGLDAEDDVEWAGAGSKDGVADVEAAMKKFEKLVLTYIASVEETRKRPDIDDVTKTDMTILLDTLDEVVGAWDKVNRSLKEVKKQVELAMEWEELWNIVLGEIGQEIDELGTLVFELEEKRHRGKFDEAFLDHSSAAVNIQELETIVEETPPSTNGMTANAGRFSSPPNFPPGSPLASPGLHGTQEDSGLLTLFARMQPLRASLDFLPMRLASYNKSAEKIFPSACGELEARRRTLEKKYKDLEKDAQTLRNELGEDRWVVVFRTAARQAQKMCESVERGRMKLRETLEIDAHAANATLLTKRIADYEAKKNNYGPAIRKVLSMIEKGVKERLTVNGEVLRIHADTKTMWIELETRLHETDDILEEVQANRSQQLRDSISTVMSNDLSGGASAVETPGSSPASSPAVGPHEHKPSLPSTPDLAANRSRNSSIRSLSSSRPPTARRVVSQPASTPKHLTSPMARLSSASPSPGPRAASNAPTPTNRSRTSTTSTPPDNRPRWSAGGKWDSKTMEAKKHTPSQYALRLKNSRPSVYSYRTPRSTSSVSGLPSPSPLGLSASVSSAPPPTTRAASSLGIRGRRESSPSLSVSALSASGAPRARLYRPSMSPAPFMTPRLGGKRTSMLPVPSVPNSPLVSQFKSEDAESSGTEEPTESQGLRPKLAVRPATSMAYSNSSSVPSGRSSSMMVPMRAKQTQKKDVKPLWK